MMGSWVEGSNMDETEAADLAATVEDDITDDTSIDGITIDAPDVSVEPEAATALSDDATGQPANRDIHRYHL